MSETTTFVIFGASGDLTRRKLVPALFDLHQKNRIWANWRIVGVSRTEFSNEEFHARMRGGVSEFGRMMCTDEEWYEFSARISYFPGSLSDLDTMHELDAYLKKMEGDETSNRVYYLSIAPDLYIPAVQNLGAAEMAVESNGWRRLVIEKPFGHDLASAQELNSALHEVFDESQVYRIDHYLGKETVQNIMVFRFANSLFEPVWNRNYIDHVQITAAETVDVGHRAHFYDGVGIMRDMMQNHMMQLLALVAVEPPASYEADSLRNEKVKILKAVRPIKPEQTAEHTVRGQYRSYRDAEGVAEKSQTATFAAIKLYIDNWRWQGVPFYLRSGKALAGKTTNITIFFKQPPHLMFNLPPETRIDNNFLSICIQPDEGIHFSFQVKEPDVPAGMRSVEMTFHYEDAFGPMAIPDAYERLLLDVVKGDASLFTRGDSIELSWAIIDPILEGWASEHAPPLYFYESDSWGPTRVDRFLPEPHMDWADGCLH